MISLTAHTATLGHTTVLHAIDFAADAGEFVALCGPNGAGKTTLLRTLAGLLPGGRPDPRRIAYVEQGARAAWNLTVADTVALGRIPWNDAARAPIDAAMAACGVTQFADRPLHTLSGGQARRAMLARALATQAPVLLLDEPVADLDPRAAHDIMALLATLARNGRCIVAVLHAVELAAEYATRMVVLGEGHILADGAPGKTIAAAAAAFDMEVGEGIVLKIRARRSSGSAQV